MQAGRVALASGAQIVNRSGFEASAGAGFRVGEGAKPAWLVATEGYHHRAEQWPIASTAGQGLGEHHSNGPDGDCDGSLIKLRLGGQEGWHHHPERGSLAAMEQTTISVVATEASMADGGDIQVQAQGHAAAP